MELNKYIYLQSDPDKCIERIKKRSRECEKNITLNYINNIHELHEDNYKLAINQNKNILIVNIEDKEIDEINEIIMNYIYS